MRALRRFSATPPILAATLLAGGILSLAASVAANGFDLAQWIERRIAAAQGSVSAETAAWLREIDFGGALRWAGLGLVVAAVAVEWARPLWQPWVAAGGEGSANARASRWVMVLGCAAVLARYHATLLGGYFRYDDFELLTVAQDQPLWPALWLPHGDHFMPLTRVLALAGWKLFGVTAWPYNAWLLLCLCGVVLAGCALLVGWGASPASLIVFVVLVVFWSPWAELMAGYYVLSTYLLIAGLGLSAVCLYLRWQHEGGAWRKTGALVAVLLATLVDVSGWYVPAAFAVFVAARLMRSPDARPAHRSLLIGFGAIVTLSLAITLYDYTVLYRGTFLSMAAEGERTFPRLVLDWAYLLDAGLLVSLVAPFIYARMPLTLLAAVALVMTSGAIVLFVAGFRARPRERRVTLAALVVVLMGIGLMVTLGRPSGEGVFVRWAAKHVGPALVWLALLVALSWDALWRRAEERRRVVFGEFTAAALGAYLAAQGGFGMLGMGVAFPPFGYPAELRDALRRRAAVADLREHVVHALPRGATVPALDGNFIAAQHRSLFSYNLSHYRPFWGEATDAVKLVRSPAMQTWHTSHVRTVPVLRDAVSPEFLALLSRDPNLQKFYLGEAALRTETKPRLRPAANEVAVESDGTTEFMVRAAAWDPEAAPRLVLAIRCEDPRVAKEVPLALRFRGDRFETEGRATLTLRAGADLITVADLRQLYAFALSTRVEALRVVLTRPGRYRIATAEMAP